MKRPFQFTPTLTAPVGICGATINISSLLMSVTVNPFQHFPNRFKQLYFIVNQRCGQSRRNKWPWLGRTMIGVRIHSSVGGCACSAHTADGAVALSVSYWHEGLHIGVSGQTAASGAKKVPRASVSDAEGPWNPSAAVLTILCFQYYILILWYLSVHVYYVVAVKI